MNWPFYNNPFELSIKNQNFFLFLFILINDTAESTERTASVLLKIQ